ncbi:MAG: sporulation protein YunB [Clostridiales bacterium]|nr:sporulation protein YunB [Clostridiales bacterium]
MKKIKKRKNATKITFVFFIIFLLIIYYFCVMSPIIKTYSSQETKSITEKAINLAVSNVINRTLSYDSLIDIHYAPSGEIVSFSANQYEINSITREIVKETQYQMGNLGQNSLSLNLGTFSGIPFLIGRGPKIDLKLVPIGVVSSNFESEFESVGINMTKHTLFLYIDVHVSIVMPIKSYDVYTTNQVLLAESIIMGKVPEVYLNGGSLGKSLNLVP